MDKLQGALGLARRAGALTTGYDAVREAAQKGEAKLVLLCADTAERTARHIKEACAGHCQLAEIPTTQQQVAALCGKPAGVLAITDENLAKLCQSALPQTGGQLKE